MLFPQKSKTIYFSNNKDDNKCIPAHPSFSYKDNIIKFGGQKNSLKPTQYFNFKIGHEKLNRLSFLAGSLQTNKIPSQCNFTQISRKAVQKNR